MKKRIIHCAVLTVLAVLFVGCSNVPDRISVPPLILKDVPMFFSPAHTKMKYAVVDFVDTNTPNPYPPLVMSFQAIASDGETVDQVRLWWRTGESITLTSEGIKRGNIFIKNPPTDFSAHWSAARELYTILSGKNGINRITGAKNLKMRIRGFLEEDYPSDYSEKNQPDDPPNIKGWG